MGKNLKILFSFLCVVLCLAWMGVGKVKCFYSDFDGILMLLRTSSVPVIKEVRAPKSYFISQAGSIDLSGYATAYDEYDGDITDSIQYSVLPQFDPNKANDYQITYTVTNSAGMSATPLNTSVLVWDFVKIVSGSYHSLALTAHGMVYVWGDNFNGQLGLGDKSHRPNPTRIGSLSGIIDIAASNQASFALDESGKIYSWGSNASGQLGRYVSTPQVKPALINAASELRFSSVSAGYATVGAVTEEGDVYTWGDGTYGSLGDGGTKDRNTPLKIGVSNIKSLAINQYHGAALDADGRLFTWGSNNYGSLGIGNDSGIRTPALVPYFENIPIKNISLGWLHMAAIDEEGKLYTWGHGANNALGDGSGSTKTTPQHIELALPASKVVAGFDYTGVILSGGLLCFFGKNDYGKHGSGDTQNHPTPYYLPNTSPDSQIINAVDLSLGALATMILSEGRTVYAMGYGGSGVLANGGTTNSSLPNPWSFVPPAPV